MTPYQIKLIFRFLYYMATRRTTPGEISREEYDFGQAVIRDLKAEFDPKGESRW